MVDGRWSKVKGVILSKVEGSRRGSTWQKGSFDCGGEAASAQDDIAYRR